MNFVIVLIIKLADCTEGGKGLEKFEVSIGLYVGRIICRLL